LAGVVFVRPAFEPAVDLPVERTAGGHSQPAAQAAPARSAGTHSPARTMIAPSAPDAARSAAAPRAAPLALQRAEELPVFETLEMIAQAQGLFAAAVVLDRDGD